MSESYINGSQLDHFIILMNDEDIKAIKTFVGKFLHAKTVNSRQTLLMIAVSQQNVAVVKMLIDMGIRVNRIDAKAETALMMAIKLGNAEIVKLLTDNFPLTPRVGYQFKELEIAVRCSNLEIISIILNKMIEKQIRSASYVIHNFADNNFAVIELLLQSGMYVAIDAFRSSLVQHRFTLAKLYIERGANVNHDVSGKTFLMHFASKNDLDTIKFLLDNHADKNQRDWDGNTAVFYSENEEIFNLLISNDDVFHVFTNEYGGKLSLLMKASQSGKIWMVDTILAHGADVNFPDNKGRNALFYARDLEMVHHLLSKNIRTDIRDNDDTHVILHAINNRSVEIVGALIDASSAEDVRRVLDVFDVLVMRNDESSIEIRRLLVAARDSKERNMARVKGCKRS